MAVTRADGIDHGSRKRRNVSGSVTVVPDRPVFIMAYDQRSAKPLLPPCAELFHVYAKPFGGKFRLLTIERDDWFAGHDPRHQRVGNIRDARTEIDKERRILKTFQPGRQQLTAGDASW